MLAMVSANPPRQARANPIRFTGPSVTFMPFNPFQKFSVDFLGVGLGKKKTKKGKKNPPGSLVLNVFTGEGRVYNTDPETALQSAWVDDQVAMNPSEVPVDTCGTFMRSGPWLSRVGLPRRGRKNPVVDGRAGELDLGHTTAWAYEALELVWLTRTDAGLAKHQVHARPARQADRFSEPGDHVALAPIARIRRDHYVKIREVSKRVRGEAFGKKAEVSADRKYERWKRKARDLRIERMDGYDAKHPQAGQADNSWFCFDLWWTFDLIWAAIGTPHPLERWNGWPGGAGERREIDLLEAAAIYALDGTKIEGALTREHAAELAPATHFAPSVYESLLDNQFRYYQTQQSWEQPEFEEQFTEEDIRRRAHAVRTGEDLDFLERSRRATFGNPPSGGLSRFTTVTRQWPRARLAAIYPAYEQRIANSEGEHMYDAVAESLAELAHLDRTQEGDWEAKRRAQEAEWARRQGLSVRAPYVRGEAAAEEQAERSARRPVPIVSRADRTASMKKTADRKAAEAAAKASRLSKMAAPATKKKKKKAKKKKKPGRDPGKIVAPYREAIEFVLDRMTMSAMARRMGVARGSMDFWDKGKFVPSEAKQHELVALAKEVASAPVPGRLRREVRRKFEPWPGTPPDVVEALRVLHSSTWGKRKLAHALGLSQKGGTSIRNWWGYGTQPHAPAQSMWGPIIQLATRIRQEQAAESEADRARIAARSMAPIAKDATEAVRELKAFLGSSYELARRTGYHESQINQWILGYRTEKGRRVPIRPSFVSASKILALYNELIAPVVIQTVPADRDWVAAMRRLVKLAGGQKQAAEVLGATVSGVNRILRGRGSPGPALQVRIVDALEPGAFDPASLAPSHQGVSATVAPWREGLKVLAASNLTHQEIATEIGVSRSAVSNWYRRDLVPRPATQVAITTLAAFLEGKPPVRAKLPPSSMRGQRHSKHLSRATPDSPFVRDLRRLTATLGKQALVAQQLGVSESTLSMILNGQRGPSVDFVERVLELLEENRLMNPRQAAVARLATPSRSRRERRRNRDAKWKKEPNEYEVPLAELESNPTFGQADKSFRRFHGTDPARARVIQIPDGKDEVTRDPTIRVALGLRQQTPYVVPWDSNKDGPLWYHDHPEGTEPLMVLNPQTGIVSDVGGSYVIDDWFYS